MMTLAAMMTIVTKLKLPIHSKRLTGLKPIFVAANLTFINAISRLYLGLSIAMGHLQTAIQSVVCRFGWILCLDLQDF